MDEFEDIEDMFHAALALAHQPPPRGNRLALLTNAGGPAALAADALETAGLALAHTSPETRSTLQTFLNANAPLDGPVDMLGAAGVEHYRQALEALLADPANDGVLVILVPTILVDSTATLKALVQVMSSSRAGKPVLACLFGEASLSGAYAAADQGGLPAYRFPEQAIRAFSALHRRALWLGGEHPQPLPPEGVNSQKARELLATALQAGRTHLDAVASRLVLQTYGIQSPEDILVTSPEGAANQAARIGFPVAMKLISPDILHKTEVGGVLLNLENHDAVWEGFGKIVQRARQAYPRAEILGVQIQRMIRGGQEVIIGMKRDPVHGPLVMFGLGGIHVEALADVSFRLPPLTRQDAEAMIDEVRSSRLLSGLRGAPPADRPALVDTILRVGQLAVDCPEIVEMDINPLIVLPAGQGALAVDARIILTRP
jgi:acetyltransferase